MPIKVEMMLNFIVQKKTTNFFPLEQQQVFGNTLEQRMGDPARYDSGILKTNQLPFTQERSKFNQLM